MKPARKIPFLLVPQLVQPVRIGALSTNLVQDQRDDSANPHCAIYNTVEVELAARFFGSLHNFACFLVRNAFRLARLYPHAFTVPPLRISAQL